MIFCECGCGQEVSKEGNRFIHGHHGKTHMWTAESKKRQAEGSKGKKYALGHKQSKEHKRKIGEGNKGKRQSEMAKQKIADANRGKTVSEETKMKVSVENHYNWQGGISFGKYCPKFNNSVKEMIRDKFGRVCFMCGKTEEDNGRKLDVHHVDYNKMQGCDDHEWRLVPLCASCHGKTSNGDRDYWESLILGILATYK